MLISDWSSDVCSSDLHNATLARVVSVDGSGVTVETAGKEQLTLPMGDPMLSRLDLAYSLNMHMAQGITTDRAIGVMSSFERFLSNQRLFNVLVTRVRDGLTMIVDRSEEHTSELQSLMRISYAVFCLKKNKKIITKQTA